MAPNLIKGRAAKSPKRSRGRFQGLKLSISRSRDDENVKDKDSSPPPPPPSQRGTNTKEQLPVAATKQQHQSIAHSSLQQQAQQQRDRQGGQRIRAQNQNTTRSTSTSHSSHTQQQASNTNNINNSNNNTMAGSHARRVANGSSGNDNDSKLAAIHKVYGPTANIYNDVLKVSPTATPSEVREAFFCLRYDIYQTLDAGNGNTVGNNGVGSSKALLTSDERKVVEARMDAITGAFHILSDTNGRRKEYDASLSLVQQLKNKENKNLETDDMGFPIANRNNNNKSGGKSSSEDNANNNNNKSPPRLTPSKSDKGLPIGQRRSVFRRRAQRSTTAPSASSGMNEARRVQAKSVEGGLNARPNPSASSAEDSIFGNSGSGSGNNITMSSSSLSRSNNNNKNGRSESPRFDSLVGNGTNKSSFSTQDLGNTNPSQDYSSANHVPQMAGGAAAVAAEEQNHINVTPPFSNGANNNNVAWQNVNGQEEPPLPAGVNNMNAREQMLYKNQMYLQQQKLGVVANNSNNNSNRSSSGNEGTTNNGHGQMKNTNGSGSKGRVGSRYNDTNERRDKYTINSAQNDDSGGGAAAGLVSPTGVDDFDHAANNNWNNQNKVKNNKNSSRQVDEESVEQTLDDDDDDDDDDATSAYDDETYGDETMTYGDDETMTLGETIDDTTVGESTWASASAYDDESSFATDVGGGGTDNNDNNTNQGKYSPGHKKGTVPQPILKSGLNKTKSVKRSDSDARRVTIHSHRGRGEENEDFSIFENATCPIPSLSSISEEVSGTYKDFKETLHQVSNAFTISPDDIDRMADKIRDAKIELGENYEKQVKERQGGGGGGTRGGEKARGTSERKVKSAMV